MLITQNGEAKLAVTNVRSYEHQEETLAMGNRDIEQGRYRNAEEVFTELDKEDRE